MCDQKEKWLMQIEEWDQQGPFPRMATIRFFGAEICSSLKNVEGDLKERGYECEIKYDVKETEGALPQLTVKKRNITDYIRFETSDFVEINIAYSGKGMRQNQGVFSMARFIEDSDYSFVKAYVREFLDVLTSS